MESFLIQICIWINIRKKFQVIVTSFTPKLKLRVGADYAHTIEIKRANIISILSLYKRSKGAN